MDLEKQFETAVRLITSLPENGPYQPSQNLMILLNSYHKQATLGPCNEPKPRFFETTNRAQWNTWNSLGLMSKNEAMKSYIYEITKIVETMSFTPAVEEFLETIGPFYEYVKEDNCSIDKSSTGKNLDGQENAECFEILSSKAKELDACMNNLHEVIDQESLMIKQFWNDEQINFSQNDDQVSERSNTEISVDSTLPELEDLEESESEVYEDTMEDNFDSGITSLQIQDQTHSCGQNCYQILYSLQKLSADVKKIRSKVCLIEQVLLESKQKYPQKTENQKSKWSVLSELSSSSAFLLAAWPFAVYALIGIIKHTTKK